tara:strand:- start:1633 stop:2610 length:978 start_codon:yes stop_codon:yes gene_type:complete
LKKILYRFDANKKIGLGHLIRCCQLAKEFKKKKAQNILYGNIKNADNLFFKTYFQKVIKVRSSDTINETNEIIRIYKKFKCNLLVLDRFNSSKRMKEILKKKNIKWFEFIKNLNLSNPPTFGICSIPYKNTKKNFFKDKIFLGKSYSVLRDQFYKKKSLKTKNYIFINTGGGNDKGSTIFILKKTLPLLSQMKIFLLVGNNSSLPKIREWIKQNDKKKMIKILLNKENIINYIDQSLFAICSGGTISQEIDSRSKRMMIFSITKNQVLQSKNWENFGHHYLGKFQNIKNTKFKKIFQNLKKLKEKRFKVRNRNYLRVIDKILREI